MRQAVHLNPYSWSAHTIYGVVLVENGDCADADQEFAAALDLNPSDALTRAQLARCLAKQSQGAPPVSKPGEL
jgi:Flp pilus assembly protein TadD